MIDALHSFFAAAPLAAVALALALGYLAGKIRVRSFVLGPVAATLLVAIALGQVGIKLSGEVKTLAFALFIYALGYMIGPQFVGSLGRATLKQVRLTVITSVVVVITVWAIARVFGLDKGTAAGVLAGGATESAVIGTAADALASLAIAKEEVARMTANIGVAYAITYLLCGRQASTPALNAVTLAAGSNVPVIGYTVPYTLANVLLTLAGPVVVLLV
jgi:AspT/YidE/YbjL antiporter-like protein